MGNKQTLSTDAPIHINHLPVRGHLPKIAAPTISIRGKGRYSEVSAAPLNAANPVQAASQRSSRFRFLDIKSLEPNGILLSTTNYRKQKPPFALRFCRAADAARRPAAQGKRRSSTACGTTSQPTVTRCASLPQASRSTLAHAA